MNAQLDDQGRLRHLLTLAALPAELIVELLDHAEHYLGSGVRAAPGALAGRTVACVFCEPSTRTRVSFELAALRLGAHVINIDLPRSSDVKGESLIDTIHTLEAMGVDLFVVRTAEPGVPAAIAAAVGAGTAVVNAGEAHVSHPTQGLLDALTIRLHKPRFERLRIGIVGDIAHSRVARSAAEALRALGVAELRLIAPAPLQAPAGEFPGAVRHTSIETGLAALDVVMALRIQTERMDEADIPNRAEYSRRFGLTPERLALLAPDAIVMHPGPMNRGVEIDDAVADGPRSVVREQVRNGVAVRMAVLSVILAEHSA